MNTILAFDLCFCYFSMSNTYLKRARRSTGETLKAEGPLNSSGRRSYPNINIKEVLNTAKLKFESEQDENALTVSPVKRGEELRRKASSAPTSPGKSLTVSVPSAMWCVFTSICPIENNQNCVPEMVSSLP